jgi:hypothetical protein
MDERRNAGLPESFFHSQSADSCFFGRSRGSVERLANLIDEAMTGSADSARVQVLQAYLKGIRNEEVDGGLTRFKIFPETISQDGSGAVSYFTSDGMRVTLKNLAENGKVSLSKLHGALTFIARRMVIGFHPDLFKEGWNAEAQQEGSKN